MLRIIATAVTLLFGASIYADTPAGTVTTKTPAPKASTGTVEINSWSYGASNPAPGGAGSAAGAGKVAGVGELNVTNTKAVKLPQKNPCLQPNPPRDCARPKPKH